MIYSINWEDMGSKEYCLQNTSPKMYLKLSETNLLTLPIRKKISFAGNELLLRTWGDEQCLLEAWMPEEVRLGRNKKAEGSQWIKLGCGSPMRHTKKGGWTCDKKEQYIKTKYDRDRSCLLHNLLKPHPENWIHTNSQYLLNSCSKPDTVLKCVTWPLSFRLIYSWQLLLLSHFQVRKLRLEDSEWLAVTQLVSTDGVRDTDGLKDVTKAVIAEPLHFLNAL